jgi:septum formation protein
MPNLRSREITKITLRHAKAKAGFVSSRHPHAIVIAADTLLSCQGKVLGKPSRLAQAREMLMHIHGRRVVAATSICVYSLHQKRCWTEQATIRFKIITPGLLRRYLASNAWRGKAGGFNVKEKPVSGWIVQIKGDLNTVVGLPLKQLKPILRGLP